MATQNIKSKSFKEGSYQVLTANIFLSEMLSFQAGAFRIFKASLFLKGNSNFFKQSGFGIRFCFIDSAKGGFRKGKGKVTSLVSNGGFEEAGSFKKSHYINTSNIHKFQVYLS